MATQNSKAGKQSKSADAEREAPAQAPEDTTLVDAPAAAAPAVEATAVAAAAVEAPVSPVAAAPAPKPAAEAVEVVSKPLATLEQVVESTTEAFSASFAFDASLWSKKSLELWAESAAAFLDLAERIVKAQTFDEVIDLQSQFASERFEAFVRQSKDLMELAQSMASVSTAPLCEVRKAA